MLECLASFTKFGINTYFPQFKTTMYWGYE